MRRRAGSDRGELSLVLHTHMPYVEGYGTWPFGEEWLWEAIATCYLPLLDLFARRGAPLTLSLTPVLCDQLAAPGVPERLARFLREVRRDTHAKDVDGCRAAGHERWAAELERASEDYERALTRVERLGDGDGLLRAFAPYASWTSSATHAVLPLLATDAGVRLQLESGIAAHRERFGAVRAWAGGFWLPECAHAPWLDPLLEEAGVHATCVDLTDVLGRGAPGQLAPIATDDGPLLVPIDRATIELAWSDAGYPSHAAYRDYHAFTVHHHRVWRNDGATYDHAAALAQARADAADFVARAIARLDAGAAALGRPALAVCALDTELLGHWWYEGIAWLGAVVEEAERQGLALAPLDEALARHEPIALADALRDARPAPRAVADVRAGRLPTTTWGTPRDLSTWDGPRVADFAWRAREAELRAFVGGPGGRPAAAPSERALRELLLLQSSDWAFQVARELAGDYPHERAAGHLAALVAALDTAAT
ncbi:MAG TPA: 1,4-alpha-glucan branching protein domain-containing protein [Conexibacter sp.]|nr:1,4-alpha-glucan branching protein domain-containing protein [Conexibacter sp.]